MKLSTAALWALIAAACLSTGCAFSREWKSASRQPADPTDLTGAWIGTWQNSNNTHNDKLKAVISRVSDTEYEARFKAWWLGVFSGTYSTTLFGHWEGNEFVFQGTQDVMGWEFKHRGRASATNFVSDYSSADYRGRFIMHRPAEGE
jgi:hypothetical protein